MGLCAYVRLESAVYVVPRKHDLSTMMSTQTIEMVRRQLANQIPPTLEQTAQLLAGIDALETLVTSAQQETAQRQHMEAALRDSDQRFRATFEQAAVGMAVVGLDRPTLYAGGADASFDI